jgi:Arc/MetJ family transcription regulator
MRTTLNLRDDLVEEACRLTGIQEKTALVHRGLEALVEKAARERLIRLGGSDPGARLSRRRRSRSSVRRRSRS